MKHLLFTATFPPLPWLHIPSRPHAPSPFSCCPPCFKTCKTTAWTQWGEEQLSSALLAQHQAAGAHRCLPATAHTVGKETGRSSINVGNERGAPTASAAGSLLNVSSLKTLMAKEIVLDGAAASFQENSTVLRSHPLTRCWKLPRPRYPGNENHHERSPPGSCFHHWVYFHTKLEAVLRETNKLDIKSLNCLDK